MNKICTSLEQSKKLLELEIDPKTADMIYYWFGSFELNDEWYELHLGTNKVNDKDIPAWSLSALLELIPKHIKQNDGRKYKFHIFNDDGIVIQRWECSYCAEDFHNRAEYLSDSHLKYPTNIYSDKYDNLIDACVEMIIKLKEKGIL